MAASRESWYLAMAYVRQEFPQPIPVAQTARNTESKADHADRKRKRTLFRGLRRRRAGLPVGLNIIRPAD
ncbi:hypothetical protein GCM10027456_76070 [Kineosporia babensis]